MDADERHDPDEMVQCHSCKEWWHEDDDGCPHRSDYCVDNENPYCDDCRQEMNE